MKRELVRQELHTEAVRETAQEQQLGNMQISTA